MFLSYQQVVATINVKTATSLTIPANATGAWLQADGQNIRYTMDNTTNPSQTEGMVLVAGAAPTEFLIDDLRRIRFIRGAGANANLNLHYFAGRDV